MWCHGIEWRHRTNDGRHPTAGFASANMSHCAGDFLTCFMQLTYMGPAKWDWLNDNMSSDFHFQRMRHSTVLWVHSVRWWCYNTVLYLEICRWRRFVYFNVL